MNLTAKYRSMMTSTPTRRFIGHYIEMVLAMFIGMAVLALPADAALLAAGTSSGELSDNAPGFMLVGMASIMTGPMVAWMRYRGHGWQPSMEMAASMFIPTFALLGLLWLGLVTDSATLLALQHAVMFPSMLVTMLLRWDEYSGAHNHHAARREVTA